MVFICTICTDVLELPGESCSIPCGHTFHKRCLVAWLNVGANCPLCKKATRKELISGPIYLSTDESVNNQTSEELKRMAINEKSQRKNTEDALMQSRILNRLLRPGYDKHQSIEAEFIAMRKSRNDINSQLGSARKKLEQMDALRAERDELSSQLAKAKAAISANQEAANNFKAQLHDTSNVVKQRDATILQLLKEKSEHVEELSKAYATIADTTTSMTALQANRDMINTQLANAKLAIAAKEFAFNELTKSRDNAELQLANAKVIFNAMQAEIDQLRETQEQFEAQMLSVNQPNLSVKTNREYERPSFDKQASRPLFYSPSTSFAFNNYLLSRLETDLDEADDNSPRSGTSTNNSVDYSRINTSDFGAATKHERGCDTNIKSKQPTTVNDYEIHDNFTNPNEFETSANKNISAENRKASASKPEFEEILYRGYHIDNTEVGESNF